MLTAQQTQRLEGLRNRSTRYEVIAEYAGGSWLVGYTARTGKGGLMAVVRRNDCELIERLEVGEESTCSVSGGRLGARLDMSHGAVVRFSGRTQREAIISGELDRI